MVFDALDNSIEEKKAEIERLDILDDTFGLEPDEAGKRESVMGELLQEVAWKESQLYQKSRIKWIQEGDINSRLFHKWINFRNKKIRNPWN